MTTPEQREVGFTDPEGGRWLLVGSHTSTVRVGETPKLWPNCHGCGTALKAQGADQ